MKNIPSEILARFDDILKLSDIPFISRPEYRKWVKYFLDFQSKYPLPGERSVQVRLFSEKLRSKGQAEVQVEQAAEALSLFFTSQQKQRGDFSSIGDGTVLNAVVRDAPGKTREQGPVQPAVKEAGMVCEPPGSPTPAGFSERRQGRYDNWRCLRKSGYPVWDMIISLLADEIKTRHYTRKTLQHYNAARESQWQWF
jgi:hypothetical protein